MRLWRKSKFSKVLDLVEKLSKDVRDFKNILSDLEDLKDTEKEIEIKESKLIITLEAENRMLRDRLLQKDIFVENLLAQLLGGASIKNLLAQPSEVKREDTSISPATKKYLDNKKKNGGLPLP